jgi:hypothetical protein
VLTIELAIRASTAAKIPLISRLVKAARTLLWL